MPSADRTTAFGGASDVTGLERRSDLRPNCLGWRSDGIYAGADQKVAGFLSAVRTTAPPVRTPAQIRRALRQNSAAIEDTPTARSCPANWDTVSMQVGSSCRDGSDTDAGVIALDGAADGAVDASGEPAKSDVPSVWRRMFGSLDSRTAAAHGSSSCWAAWSSDAVDFCAAEDLPNASRRRATPADIGVRSPCVRARSVPGR